MTAINRFEFEAKRRPSRCLIILRKWRRTGGQRLVRALDWLFILAAYGMALAGSLEWWTEAPMRLVWKHLLGPQWWLFGGCIMVLNVATLLYGIQVIRRRNADLISGHGELL